MKKRTDFVTNSSSSSFVIAKKDACTIDEIREALMQKKQQVIYLLQSFDMDTDDGSIHMFIEEMAYKLYHTPTGLKLDDWVVSAETYGNDDDEYGCFMYEYGGSIETENFKVG